jgi:hypothetical protein
MNLFSPKLIHFPLLGIKPSTELSKAINFFESVLCVVIIYTGIYCSRYLSFPNIGFNSSLNFQMKSGQNFQEI